jgi:dihydrofolate reductase
MRPVDLSLIVAMTESGLIGRTTRLPWKSLPSDMNRFIMITKRLGIVIMGNRTFQSILSRNGKPLAGRKHIVLSRRISSEKVFHESVLFVSSPEEAVEVVANYGGHACVIGGVQVYGAFLPRPELKQVYIATVHAPDLAGDTYFELGDEFHRSFTHDCAYARKRWHERDELRTPHRLRWSRTRAARPSTRSIKAGFNTVGVATKSGVPFWRRRYSFTFEIYFPLESFYLTSTPMLRAVPAIVRLAASGDTAFMSGVFLPSQSRQSAPW